MTPAEPMLLIPAVSFIEKKDFFFLSRTLLISFFFPWKLIKVSSKMTKPFVKIRPICESVMCLL